MDFNDFNDFKMDSDDSFDQNNAMINPNIKKSHSFDFVTLIISIIGGIAGYFLSDLVYQQLGDLWSPLAIGIRIIVLFAVVAVFVLIYSLINGNQSEFGKNVLLLVVSFIAVLIVSTLFEYIYEMNFFDKQSTVYKSPTSYIFIIDNSASMNTSDPNSLRYDAIEEIIKDKDEDFPYGVYSFNSNIQCIRDVAPKSDGIGDLKVKNTGDTQIRKTLESLLEDYKNDYLDDLGDNPKFLLLSDGYATDAKTVNMMEDTLNDYVDNHITISTVGLGNVDRELMQQIADRTGGVFVSVNDAGDLENAMQTAIVKNSDSKYARTFFTYRYVPELDLMFAIMRIVFTMIIGLLISLAMMFATGRNEDFSLILISSLITSCLAGLALELGINTFDLDPDVLTAVYMVLVASTFVNKVDTSIHMNSGGRYESQNNHKYESQNDFSIGKKDKNESFGDNKLTF